MRMVYRDKREKVNVDGYRERENVVLCVYKRNCTYKRDDAVDIREIRYKREDNCLSGYKRNRGDIREGMWNWGLCVVCV